ncbi:hypothetical protein AB0O31_02410 [Kitasatospora cineracea]|uniref:hypothetical protein n=1 Tax=Kitasatospora cineracea TaxID=88074 RepID=UPI00342B9E09
MVLTEAADGAELVHLCQVPSGSVADGCVVAVQTDDEGGDQARGGVRFEAVSVFSVEAQG